MSYSGGEAKRVFDDAQRILQQVITEGSLVAHGIVGFYPANSVGDDIEVYSDQSRATLLTTLHGIRQQVSAVFVLVQYINFTFPGVFFKCMHVYSKVVLHIIESILNI